MEKKEKKDDIITRARQVIESYDGPPLRIMEVCGTHTHEIFRLGIRKILPPNVQLISGPGCPVCVTEVGFIDTAVDLALNHHVTICTFGDLIRVPGTKVSLGQARATGAKLRIVYTPLDAVKYAAEHPEEEVVFLSVGFETTAPSSALAVKKAKEEGIKNFSILVANKTMPQAYRMLKGSADAFLFPGHVNAITGEQDCQELVPLGVSGVIAGFTAKELLTAIAVILKKAKESDEAFMVNAYPRVVSPEGNPAAVALIREIFEPCDSQWRGLGTIPGSGLKLRKTYEAFDAEVKYNRPMIHGKPNPACRCGEVLQGKCRPKDCKVFGKGCTPQHPIGACMVSNEGACAAWYSYGME